MIQAAGLNKNKKPYFVNSYGRVMYYHSVIYLIKGEGFFEDDSTSRMRLTPGMTCFLYPNIWHYFDPKPGTRWTEYWITFDGIEAEKRFGSLIPSSPVHDIGLDDRIVAAYENLYNAWYFKSPGHEAYSSLLLHEILTRVHMKINGYPETRQRNPIERVKSYMRENVALSRIDYKELADRDGLTYEQLRKKFKDETGIPLTTYFLMLKMNRAKELLLNSDANISEITKQCGFAGPYYFSRFFKEREGVSPKRFRSKSFSYAERR